MKEVKTLIWMKGKDLKNAGGAGGYLYNFKYYLTKNKIENIYFLEEIQKERYRTFIVKVKSKIQKIVNFLIKDDIKKVKNSLLNTLLEDKKISKRELEKFDFIHFHSTKTLYRNLKNIENIKSKIILTSHSPQLLSMEEIESTNLENELLKDKKFIDKFKKFDYIAFKRADYIIFPCREAMEPYLKDEEMKKILLSKEKAIHFIPTGIIPNKVEEEENYFYNKFQIPKDSIIISYIGRHNKIKGYDLIVEFGKKIIEKYKNVYFVIAGKEDGVIKKPLSNQWIECGWTTEGLKIMKNCDLFILPNRETYFDLIFLELLS